MIIQEPIFIIGSGRSGTTLFYNILAGHRDLAWFSNYTDRYPNKPWFAKFNALYKNITLSKKYRTWSLFPKPSEGFNIWNYFHPLSDIEDAGASSPLYEDDIKDTNIPLMKKIISKHIEYSNATRFLNKNTRNTRRSRYLKEIFHDCIFIHMIRDGRAVINSLLNVQWWNDLPLWYRNDFKTPSQLIKEGYNEILLAAKMWKNNVNRLLEDKKKIPKNQYHELRYEEFINDPHTCLKNILSFCNLKYYEDYEKFINSFNIINMDYKWKNEFTNDQIEMIEDEIGSLLKKLKYL